MLRSNGPNSTFRQPPAGGSSAYAVSFCLAAWAFIVFLHFLRLFLGLQGQIISFHKPQNDFWGKSLLGAFSVQKTGAGTTITISIARASRLSAYAILKPHKSLNMASTFPNQAQPHIAS
jgi:hypothetical protein